MNDRAVELLEQYDIEVLRTRRGRGAILCDTRQGSLVFKEYFGNEERLKVQDRLLRQVADAGVVPAELILPNKEGALLVKDNDNNAYVLKTWQDGRECSIYDKEECIEAVRLLARLHDAMRLPAPLIGSDIGMPGLSPMNADSDAPGTSSDFLEIPASFSPEKEYDKHNRELKRVRRFLQQKGQKTWFEISLKKHFDFFLEQALAMTEEWKGYCIESGGSISPAGVVGSAADRGFIPFCHGDYQYHNILRDGSGWFLVNFEKCLPDNQIRDLYLLLRKLLEKGNWSVALGEELLEAYDRERPIGAMSRVDLYYRLAYPEKFWKIANFYYNSGKAWIPGRNQEKLDKLVEQEKDKQHFLDEVFRNVGSMREKP